MVSSQEIVSDVNAVFQADMTEVIVTVVAFGFAIGGALLILVHVTTVSQNNGSTGTNLFILGGVVSCILSGFSIISLGLYDGFQNPSPNTDNAKHHLVSTKKLLRGRDRWEQII